MSETGLFEFQIGEILPALEAFLLCFSVGLGAIAIKVLWCKCKK